MKARRRLLRARVRGVRRLLRRTLISLALCSFLSVFAALYVLLGWIQLSLDDEKVTETGPFYSLDNGAPTGDGGWQVEMTGYHFSADKVPLRVLLSQSVRRIIRLRRWSPKDWQRTASEVWGSWEQSKEQLGRDIDAPVVDMRLTQNKLAFLPGDKIQLEGVVHLPAEAMRLARKHGWKPCLAYAVDRVFDSRGRYRSPLQFGMGSLLTTTGVPIESSLVSLRNSLIGSPYKSPIEGLLRLGDDSQGIRTHGSFPVSIQEPVRLETPTGFFRMSFQAGAFTDHGWVQVENWPDLDAVLDGRYAPVSDAFTHQQRILQGPLFRVGESATPRLIWTLLNTTFTSQTRGVLAREDQADFGLALTGIHQNNVVVPPFDRQGQPIQYDLSPYFPTQAPSYGRVFPDNTADSVNAYYPPLPLAIGTGHWQLEIRGPKDMLVAKDEGDFDRMTYYRAFSDRLRISFPKYGKYVIRLQGWVEDIYGHRLEGGGAYTIYAALPLSFSSSSKPGQGYAVGRAINTRLHVFPPGRTTVRFTVDYFPNSDPAAAVHWQRETVSNRFGYYDPGPDDLPPFDRPGEYRLDTEASREEPGGVLRYGHVRESGVVYDPETVLDLQGHPLFPTLCASISEPGAQNASISNTIRVPITGGGENLKTVFLPSDQTLLTLLSDTEGQYYGVHPTLTWKPSGDAGFSPVPWKSEPERREDKSCTEPDCFWDSMPGRSGHAPLPGWFSDFAGADVCRDVNHPTPVVSYTHSGCLPALYPEDISVKSYCYLSAFRPGMVIRQEALDESNSESYWIVSPDASGHHMNARLQGDVMNDHYRVVGSCVRKEFDTGRVFYGYYAHSIAISPGPSDLNGYFYNGAAPIVEVAGEKIFRLLGSAPEPGAIFEPNEPVAIGGFVLPTTPNMPIRFSFEKPDGTVETRDGTTNHFGEFGLPPVSSGGTPGIMWAGVEAIAADGVPARILGAAANRILLFVAAPHHVRARLNLRAGRQIAANERLRVIGQAPREIVGGRVGYVRITPGAILDQGLLPLSPDGTFRFSFSAAQDTVKTGLYRSESTDLARAADEGEYGRNEWPNRADDGNIQMGIVFVAGHDLAGRPVTANAYFLLKGNTVIYVDETMAGPEEDSAPSMDDSRPTIPDPGRGKMKISTLADCQSCHKSSRDRATVGRARPLVQWEEIMNWHRSKSVNLFWLPHEDETKLAERELASAETRKDREGKRRLIAARCNVCHIPFEELGRKDIRYSRDGWRRYVDYRYPPTRKNAVPAQKYGWLRDIVPGICLQCHSTSIPRVTPAIPPLGDDERRRLIDALREELDGEARLYDDSDGGPSVEKRLYQETCYACHSLELKLAERDPRMDSFVPQHLKSKAGERVPDDEVRMIVSYLQSLRPF